MATIEFVSHRMQLATRIKDLRETQGLSGRRFAMMIGISRTYLRKIEAAEASPTFDMMERIAAGLDVAVRDMVDFETIERRRLVLDGSFGDGAPSCSRAYRE